MFNIHIFNYIDKLIYILLILIIIDYLTGVIVAILNHKLSSSIGYEGILKKISIFLVIFLAYALDFAILDNNNVLHITVTVFYISNEAISILENITIIGIPVPMKLKLVLNKINEGNYEDK